MRNLISACFHKAYFLVKDERTIPLNKLPLNKLQGMCDFGERPRATTAVGVGRMEGRATLARNLSTHTEATKGRACMHSLALREYCCVMALCVTNLGLDPRPPLPHPYLTLYLLSCALWLTAPHRDYGCTKHPWVSSLWLRYERNQPRAARSDVLPPPRVTNACRTVWDAGDQRFGTASNMVQQRM